MSKHNTNRFSNFVKLLVGVCLIGSVFHVHQLHPDYTIQAENIPLHLSVDKPDCVACMNLIQAIPAVYDNGHAIRHDETPILLLADQYSLVVFVSDLNNKSPPI